MPTPFWTRLTDLSAHDTSANPTAGCFALQHHLLFRLSLPSNADHDAVCTDQTPGYTWCTYRAEPRQTSRARGRSVYNRTSRRISFRRSPSAVRDFASTHPKDQQGSSFGGSRTSGAICRSQPRAVRQAAAASDHDAACAVSTAFAMTTSGQGSESLAAETMNTGSDRLCSWRPRLPCGWDDDWTMAVCQSSLLLFRSVRVCGRRRIRIRVS